MLHSKSNHGSPLQHKRSQLCATRLKEVTDAEGEGRDDGRRNQSKTEMAVPRLHEQTLLASSHKAAPRTTSRVEREDGEVERGGRKTREVRGDGDGSQRAAEVTQVAGT
jgi:hypothetical protein